MPYDVKCRTCGKNTRADNIVDLLGLHIDSRGRFLCSKCNGVDTYIYRISNLQEGPGETWERWIKGVIRIDSGFETYSPYIFLTADSEGGPITGLHFHYYKDLRKKPGGRLKHGHGPGGPPVLRKEALFVNLEHLVSEGALSKDELHDFVRRL